MINKDTDNFVEGTAVATPVSTPATATAVATRVNIPPAYAPSYEQANVNHTQTFIVPAMGKYGDFNDGLCDKCCQPNGYCCLVWWTQLYIPCLCCQTLTLFARSSSPKRDGYRERADIYHHAWHTLCCTILVSLFIGPLFCIIYMIILRCQTRENVRRIYKIEGNSCYDCCIACCCGPCSTIQMANQLWDDPGDVPGCSDICSSDSMHEISNMPFGDDTPLRSNYNNYDNRNPMYNA